MQSRTERGKTKSEKVRKMLKKILKQMRERVSREKYERLERIIQGIDKHVTNWGRKIAIAEYGENKVYDALMNEGYRIIEFRMKKEGIVSVERKQEKLKEPRFPDALAFSLKHKCPFEEVFFLDPKTKKNESSLGLVNVNDYNGYWRYVRYGTVIATFKIFFYIYATKKIYVHNLRDPEQEPSLEETISPKYGKATYRIYDEELEFWKTV